MRHLISCLLGLACFFWCLSPTQAQIVDVQELQFRVSKEESWKLAFSGSADWRVGNVRYLELKGGIFTGFKRGKHLFFLTGEGTYALQNNQRFNSNLFGHARYRYEVLSWLGIEGFVQHKYDEFQRLFGRFLIGMGPRFQLYKGPYASIFLGTAYLFEYNKFSTLAGAADSEAERLFHRWSNYLTLEIIAGKVLRILHTTYAQPAFADFSDFRIAMNTTLALKVNDWLTINLSHELAYQSRPPETIQPLDSTLKASFAIEWTLWKPPVVKPASLPTTKSTSKPANKPKPPTTQPTTQPTENNPPIFPAPSETALPLGPTSDAPKHPQTPTLPTKRR
ncbi:MAG: DUF481 domain-containing protein [Myxococcales bacterium]|nr:DUF481 domain-containing protein [Myxococcales bacterium]